MNEHTGEISSAPERDVASQPAALPVWLETLRMGLFSHSHLLLSGNIHDLYATGAPGGATFAPLEDALRRELARTGIGTVLTFDPVDGPGIYASPAEVQARPLEADGTDLQRADGSLDTLVELVRMTGASADMPVALIVRYASHLAAPGSEELRRMLVAVDKLSHAPPARDPASASDIPATNPVIWLLDRPGDLPDWFAVANPAVRQIRVDLPDLEERYAHACALAPRFPGAETLPEARRNAALQQFALETGGMSLREIGAVAELAARQGLGLERTGDAIRSYRTGSRRNPWASPLMVDRLRDGAAILNRRVKGQDHAISRSLQILTRSVLGLSGAQANTRLNRPRGVLFFAGPTGVGKTELAKAVTELLFGDDTMCQRFDMTEFTSERSVSRLIGAPPGYAGHELGGELTNALRRRPFSVILFDEVEKAHPRVLDMFLQILDDGRLTDSRGETSYFSDAIVIFTSNVGMLGSDTSTNLGMEILPSDSYSTLRRKLLDGIRKHFVKDLRRPELLNRVEQNVVAFNFIHHSSAEQIFDGCVARVLRTVHAELGIEVRLEPAARAALADFCLHNMLEGGRGIANRVETHLVNPLSEALLGHLDARAVDVSGIEERDGQVRVRLR